MTSMRVLLVKIGRRLLYGERSGVRQSIHGEGNQFLVGKARLVNVELDIIGSNNLIIVPDDCVLINVKFHLRGSGHRIEFGHNCRVTRSGVFWFEDEEGLLQVGANTSMVEVHIAVTEARSKVVIGEECMLANDIDIRTGDSHSIINTITGERINFAEDIVIGNHVWIAPHVVILKGVQIGDDSVVATGSIVTKSCGPGVILAGNPAGVVKSGISWRRERLEKGE